MTTFSTQIRAPQHRRLPFHSRRHPRVSASRAGGIIARVNGDAPISKGKQPGLPG